MSETDNNKINNEIKLVLNKSKDIVTSIGNNTEINNVLEKANKIVNNIQNNLNNSSTPTQQQTQQPTQLSTQQPTQLINLQIDTNGNYNLIIPNKQPITGNIQINSIQPLIQRFKGGKSKKNQKKIKNK